MSEQDGPPPWADELRAIPDETPFYPPSAFAHIEPPDELIHNYLRAGEVTLLYAPKDYYKSFLALDWGLCVASGCPWQGHRILGGNVVFYIGEGIRSYGKRYRAWCLRNRVQDWERLPVAFSRRPAGYLDNGRRSQLRADIEGQMQSWHGTSLALVVVDTLSTNIGDGDENNAGEAARLIATLNDLYVEPYNAGVLLVHHSGKDATRGARGSYALEANADTVYYLTNVSEDKDEAEVPMRPVRLVNKHSKDTERAVSIELAPRKIVLDSDGREPVPSLVLERSLGGR